MMTDLATRTCDSCGVSDTEPHHVQYEANGPGITKHVKCCAEGGCPICSSDLNRAAEEGADLEHLRDFLQHRPADHQQMLHDRFGVETQEE